MSQASQVIEENEIADTLKDKYLTFHLASEDYGLEIKYVTEIIGIQKITPVPNTPQYLKGVINLRGKVIPIMDVRRRFHLPEAEYDERTCVIVVRLDETLIGLVVDTVSEVVAIPMSDIQPPPGRTSQQNQFVQGLGKIGSDIKILLDVNRLLAEDDLNMVSELSTMSV